MSDTPQSQSPTFIRNVTNPNLVAQPSEPVPPTSATANPAPAPAPAPNPAPTPTPSVATPPTVQAQPQVSTQQPPYVPQPNPWDVVDFQQQRQRMLELERINQAQQEQFQQLQARYAEQNTTIDNLLKAQQEYDQLKAAQDATANFDYGQLTTVDPEDAKAITKNIINAVQAQLEPIKRRINDQDKQMQAATDYQERRFQQQQAAATLNKILDKHPDFLSLKDNPNYIHYLKQRDGLSSYTIDQRAASEFQLGNADYVINMLDQFKSQQPNVNSINSVAPVQTTNQTVAPAAPVQQLPTLRELNSMMQMRQITPEQYRELLKQIRSGV